MSPFNALDDKDLKNYWYQKGMPIFLMQRIRSTNFDYRLLDGGVKCFKNRLENYKDDFSELEPLLYYRGYHQIGEWKRRNCRIHPRFPQQRSENQFLD